MSAWSDPCISTSSEDNDSDRDSVHQGQFAPSPFELYSNVETAPSHHYEGDDEDSTVSCSSDEIVFCGRGGGKNLEEAFGELSIDKRHSNDEKNTIDEGVFPGWKNNDAESSGACKRTKVPQLRKRFTTKKNDQLSSGDNEDAKLPICRFWHRTSQESEFEQGDPYPLVNLNRGWNRATYQGRRHYQNKANILHNNVAIGFAGYSLTAQRRLLPVRLSLGDQRSRHSRRRKSWYVASRAEELYELYKLYHFVFQTQGPVQKPFHTCRSKVLSKPIKYPASSYHISPWLESVAIPGESEICQRIKLWLRGISCRCRAGSLKRIAWYIVLRESCLRVKRRCTRQGKQRGYRIALCDKWRKRMRERTTKKGRWTDGTLRQNRLWGEFYWVLDGNVEDDPLQQKRAYEEPVWV